MTQRLSTSPPLRLRHNENAIFILLLSIAFVFPLPITAQDEAQSRPPNDSVITEAISADIEQAERMAGANVTVEVHEGLVRLSGTVNSLLDKRLASQIAKRTRGVTAVQNQIVVARSQRSDDDIRDDVMKVLRLNDSVPEPAIEANVTRGEVSLIGKVESLAEKRIAEFAASGVKGVTDVENQIAVGLATDRNDAELRDEISALIVQSVYFDDVDIDVSVEDHVAKLSGTVFSAAAKDRPEQVAEIWGITEVDVSDAMVDAESADPSVRKERYANVADTDIRAALDRSFRYDPIVFSRRDKIDATVENGTVTLKGTVNGLRVKNLAARLAQDIVGVRRVTNELKVEYDGETPSDGEIIHLTQAALARSAQLDRREIRVHCQVAHVSLYGIVDSELEKSVAGWIADGVPGVVHVNNTLAVEPKTDTKKSDDEIESDLRRKLKYAFFDKSSQVDFTIEDGVAILRGEVDTWRQWQAVMDLAIEAGARHPHNLINVRYHPPHGGSRIYVPR